MNNKKLNAARAARLADDTFNLCGDNVPKMEEMSIRIRLDMKTYSSAAFKRAIPSYKDGLKPIHRRILWALWDNGITNTCKLPKIIGQVIPLHPHGDASIADAIIRMAQDGLVQNHALLYSDEGGFGSITSLNASAPRYLSASLSNFGKDVYYTLIDKNSITMTESDADFGEQEPEFLPTAVPLLLVNGLSGIAVGFTSSVPPHNLREICNITINYIRNKNISPSLLVKGFYPDYPVGGIVVNGDEIPKHYYTPGMVGGSVVIRGVVEIDSLNSRIIVRSLPMGYDFETFTEKTRQKSLEKDKQGNPVNLILANINYIGEQKENGVPYLYVNCKNGSNLVEIRNELYRLTPLQNRETIYLNTYGWDDRIGEYIFKKSTIKEIIKDWYEANYIVRRRKIVRKQNILMERILITEGLMLIYPNLDKLIQMMRDNKDDDDTLAQRVNKSLGITKKQALAIIAMPLSSLGRRSEKDLQKTIESLREQMVLADNELEMIDELMIQDIIKIRDKYGRDRRTEIIGKLSEVKTVISSGSILVTRNSVGIFDSSNIVSGKKIMNGFKGVKIGNSWVKEIISYNNIERELDSIVVFYDKGFVQNVKVTVINAWSPVEYEKYGFITSVCPVYKGESDKGSVICILDNGNIKRTLINDIGNRPVLIENNVCDCRFVGEKDEESEIILVDSQTNYLKFNISEVRTTGRSACGISTSYSSGSNVRMTISNSTHIMVVMENTKRGESYGQCIPTETILSIGRTNKPKKLVDIADMTVKGINGLNLAKKGQLGVFISDNSTTNLRTDNFRNMMPKKLGISGIFGFISFDIE